MTQTSNAARSPLLERGSNRIRTLLRCPWERLLVCSSLLGIVTWFTGLEGAYDVGLPVLCLASGLQTWPASDRSRRERAIGFCLVFGGILFLGYLLLLPRGSAPVAVGTSMAFSVIGIGYACCVTTGRQLNRLDDRPEAIRNR